jgi:NitT/TauT family transport system substrate-binding protein/putative hydroxymethylpyrimidine transport system substrate-binding protein
MKRVVALLAAATCAAAVAACGGGAEPGAPRGATLVLDFQPNAVHSGIYAALAEGYYGDEDADLEVQQPSSSTDAPKLLEAGKVEFAILDIHDLAIARERGFDLVALTPIVRRPLASVTAGDRDEVRRPRELEGRTVGVTGLPSDDAVLESVVAADGGDPSEVDRVTIGFNAVAALAAGRVDAATAFWNAEGVTLKREGVRTRTFRVDEYGAPRYPELVLVTTSTTLADDPVLARAVVNATTRGYRLAARDPAGTLGDLLAANPDLDRADQEAQLRALEGAGALGGDGRFDPRVLRAWARWDAEHGIVKQPPDVHQAFQLSR